MKNPKQAVGVKVIGQNWQNRTFEAEILVANGPTVKTRLTFQDNGDVIESLWSPDNHRKYIDGCDDIYKDGLLCVRTWINGDELSIDKAGGYNMQDDCLCTVLHHLYGDEFTDYTHNYGFVDGVAYELEDGDPEP